MGQMADPPGLVATPGHCPHVDSHRTSSHPRPTVFHSGNYKSCLVGHGRLDNGLQNWSVYSDVGVVTFPLQNQRCPTDSSCWGKARRLFSFSRRDPFPSSWASLFIKGMGLVRGELSEPPFDVQPLAASLKTDPAQFLLNHCPEPTPFWV